MTDFQHTVTQRIGSRLRELRAEGAWDQSTVAGLLTALGTPTKVSTVTRVEGGTQPVTVEQLLLLALVASPDGLRGLLQPPFTVGSLHVDDDADLDAILNGWHGEGRRPAVVAWARELTKDSWTTQRDTAIARSIAAAPQDVTRTAWRLYGRRADEEIVARFRARLAEAEPEPESPAWRAYRSHAVRAVTREIGEALK